QAPGRAVPGLSRRQVQRVPGGLLGELELEEGAAWAPAGVRSLADACHVQGTRRRVVRRRADGSSEVGAGAPVPAASIRGGGAADGADHGRAWPRAAAGAAARISRRRGERLMSLPQEALRELLNPLAAGGAWP